MGCQAASRGYPLPRGQGTLSRRKLPSARRGQRLRAGRPPPAGGMTRLATAKTPRGAAPASSSSRSCRQRGRPARLSDARRVQRRNVAWTRAGAAAAVVGDPLATAAQALPRPPASSRPCVPTSLGCSGRASRRSRSAAPSSWACSARTTTGCRQQTRGYPAWPQSLRGRATTGPRPSWPSSTFNSCARRAASSSSGGAPLSSYSRASCSTPARTQRRRRSRPQTPGQPTPTRRRAFSSPRSPRRWSPSLRARTSAAWGASLAPACSTSR